MLATELTEEARELEAHAPMERARLVRLCARLSGNADAAEDLAQETLVEAWRHAHRLHRPNVYPQWIAGIARNVCLRWKRQRGQERTDAFAQDAGGENSYAQLADTFDIEVELERHELADLLDRAMALLPPATRQALIERYVVEAPQAEIAARLGLSEGAVEARLQRGKLALRRILAMDLREEAVSYGLVSGEPRAWQETRIWCPFCGERKLICRLDRASGETTFRCHECGAKAGDQIVYTDHPGIIGGVTSFKAVLSRQLAWADRYYRDALAHLAIPCRHCGRRSLVEPRLPDFIPPSLHTSGITITCTACGLLDANPLRYLVLDLPATQRFWREHPRMRVIPDRETEAAGRPALVTSFESVGNADRLDVISAADTLEVLAVHGEHA